MGLVDRRCRMRNRARSTSRPCKSCRRSTPRSCWLLGQSSRCSTIVKTLHDPPLLITKSNSSKYSNLAFRVDANNVSEKLLEHLTTGSFLVGTHGGEGIAIVRFLPSLVGVFAGGNLHAGACPIGTGCSDHKVVLTLIARQF